MAYLDTAAEGHVTGSPSVAAHVALSFDRLRAEAESWAASRDLIGKRPRNDGRDPRAEVRPGPGAWPFLGHVLALQRRPLALLDSLPTHGDLVEIRLGPKPAFVICHPDLARQVLTDLRGFDRTGMVYERVRTAMGNGLASAAHRDHRRQRLVMQPAFRHEHLRGYVAVMRQEITATMENWHDGDRVDLVDEMFTPSPPRSPSGRCSPPTSTPPKPNACAAPSTLSSAASTPGRSCPWQAACPPPATAATQGPWRPGAPRSATSSRATGSPEPTAAT